MHAALTVAAFSNISTYFIYLFLAKITVAITLLIFDQFVGY